ncbi:MAG: 16S rRNA (cytidine(1402)-2'-O)-methyltransferase [Caldisericia bacterium]|nr:16S rRNA (cytidine(1402)-2'-O)-methyltransferase [Caldisericia bacterium]
MSGILYICATPIGNLDDASPRLIETLSKSSLILAEDTRRTQKLLSKFGLHVQLESFFEHNERMKLDKALFILEGGSDVSLVSDAGVPTIADPGQLLVDHARDKGIEVIPIPGPSAVMAALSVSGFFAQTFTFRNFLPRKKGALTKVLMEIAEEKRTTVILESPQRLSKLLEVMTEVMPTCQVLVAREMTKKHEEYLRGSPRQILDKIADRGLKGEVTVVIGFNPKFFEEDD